MKLRVECSIQGQTRLEQPVIFTFKDVEYEFMEEGGVLSALRVTKPLPSGVEYEARYIFGRDGELEDMSMNLDEAVLDGIMEQIKTIESILAFEFEIRRIDWQTPKLSLIPETPEEQRRVEFKDFFRQKMPHSTPITVTHEGLLKAVTRRRIFAPLAVLKSFWREGRNELEAERYIAAFINFFFILESLYSNGESKKKLMLKEFVASAELTHLVAGATQLMREDAAEHLEQILAMLKHRNKELDVHGTLYLLIETRGELSHFIQESGKAYGNPFRNDDYEAIAVFAYMLVTAVIYQKRNELLAAERERRAKQGAG
ncbi:MAG: hypothetical protein M1541_04825 [Acidobacteria bacterium]|nr:hypothetical protein [Acidobacteriota bacterium]